MTLEEIAKALHGLNTPSYISNITKCLLEETKSSVVAELTKLAV